VISNAAALLEMADTEALQLSTDTCEPLQRKATFVDIASLTPADFFLRLLSAWWTMSRVGSPKGIPQRPTASPKLARPLLFHADHVGDVTISSVDEAQSPNEKRRRATLSTPERGRYWRLMLDGRRIFAYRARMVKRKRQTSRTLSGREQFIQGW
jgi:hypothetical protein